LPIGSSGLTRKKSEKAFGLEPWQVPKLQLSPVKDRRLVMTIRHVCRALTVAALTCGVSAIGAVARAHDHDPYIAKTSPKAVKATKATHEHHDSDDNKNVILVGCFIRVTDSDGDHLKRYVLANATPGPATTVADQNCADQGSAQLIRLRDVDDVGLDQIASGRWVEVSGELGKPRDADDMRKFELKSFREVPQTPRVALFMPIPAPAVETPAPEPQAHVETPEPIATTGVDTPKKLPKTASELPLVALLGLFTLSGGLVLGLVDRRRA
jgi:LPXTG-motif cell wall-anchored protein